MTNLKHIPFDWANPENEDMAVMLWPNNRGGCSIHLGNIIKITKTTVHFRDDKVTYIFNRKTGREHGAVKRTYTEKELYSVPTAETWKAYEVYREDIATVDMLQYKVRDSVRRISKLSQLALEMWPHQAHTSYSYQDLENECKHLEGIRKNVTSWTQAANRSADALKWHLEDWTETGTTHETV